MSAATQNTTIHHLQPSMLLRRYFHDPMYRSSILIIASTFINSLLGFAFWTISARLYSSHDVGLATTMTSSISLISTASLLGYNTALLRYMYHSNNQTLRLNTSLTLVSATSLVIGAFFVILLTYESPKLIFIQHSAWLSVVFVLTATVTTCYLMLDSVFIVFQRADMLLLKNSILSLGKLAAVFLFTMLGATGIFLANAFGVIIAVTIALVVVVVRMGYKIGPHFDGGIAKEMSRFAWINYAASAIESASVFLLPILITNGLGPRVSGYFYMDMMIAGAIYIIPVAVSQVVLARGSRHGSYLLGAVKKAVWVVGVLLVPAMLVVVGCGRAILGVFGNEYARNGYVTLVLFVVAGVPMAVKLVSNAVFNVERKLVCVMVTNGVTAGMVIGLSLWWMQRGLSGVGSAWLVGETGGALVAVIFVVLRSSTLGSGWRGTVSQSVGRRDVR